MYYDERGSEKMRRGEGREQERWRLWVGDKYSANRHPCVV